MSSNCKVLRKNVETNPKLLEGSPLVVLEVLEIFAQKHRVATDNKLWPKSPNALSRRLNQIRSNLIEGLGIEVKISRVTSGKNKNKVNTFHIEIRKIPPAEQNHERN
jgi:hypothetical protein